MKGVIKLLDQVPISWVLAFVVVGILKLISKYTDWGDTVVVVFVIIGVKVFWFFGQAEVV